MNINFNPETFGKKKSRIIRADESLRLLIDDAKLNIAGKINTDSTKISTTLATRKIVDWANLGKQVELCKQNKKGGQSFKDFLKSLP